MWKSPTRARIAAAGGMLLLACAISQCSLFSPTDVPVDCDVVKNQQQAGVTDDAIAKNLGSTVDKVAACHGPKTAVPMVY
jgi:hypothetical protein